MYVIYLGQHQYVKQTSPFRYERVDEWDATQYATTEDAANAADMLDLDKYNITLFGKGYPDA